MKSVFDLAAAFRLKQRSRPFSELFQSEFMVLSIFVVECAFIIHTRGVMVLFLTNELTLKESGDHLVGGLTPSLATGKLWIVCCGNILCAFCR